MNKNESKAGTATEKPQNIQSAKYKRRFTIGNIENDANRKFWRW